MPRRLGIAIAALAVGAMFAAGLFVPGILGGVLLIVTDLMLIGLSRVVWDQVNPRRRPVRILIATAIAVIAVVKIAKG